MKKLSMLAILALILAATTVAAQPSIEIVPVLGVYYPTGTLVSQELFDPEVGTIDVEMEHKTGLLLGARVDVWMAGGLGVEGSLMYAMSDVEATGSSGGISVSMDQGASTFLAAGKLAYRFAAPGSPARFHLLGGLAMIKHGGDAFEDVDGTTDIGAVLGLGATFSLPGTMGIRIDVEDYIYSAKFGEGDAESDSELQNDIVLTAGLAFKLGM